MRAFFIAAFLFLTGCRADVPASLPVVETRVDPPKREVPLVLKADYVADVLGEPALKRRENPSEVWLYSAEGCILFVYFNADGEVKHMEIGEPSKQAPHRGEACLVLAGKLR